MTKTLRIVAVQERCGGVNETTIYRWIKTNGFPPPLKLARRVALWDEAQVDAWIESKRPKVCEILQTVAS